MACFSIYRSSSGCLFFFLDHPYSVSVSFLEAHSARRREQTTGSNQAEQKKKLANDAFQAKNFKEAVGLHGEATNMVGDGAPAIYFSNRAVAWAALGELQHVRDDAVSNSPY